MTSILQVKACTQNQIKTNFELLAIDRDQTLNVNFKWFSYHVRKTSCKRSFDRRSFCVKMIFRRLCTNQEIIFYFLRIRRCMNKTVYICIKHHIVIKERNSNNVISLWIVVVALSSMRNDEYDVQETLQLTLLKEDKDEYKHVRQ